MKYGLFYIVMLFACSAFAQTSQWINYTSGQVVSAFATEGNFLWIGTADGLVKMDKVSGAKTFYNRTNSGLPGNTVTSIAIDAQGNKWIGTWGGGLAKFDGASWTLYNSLNSQMTADWITRLKFSADGRLWICEGSYLPVDLVSYNGVSFTQYDFTNGRVNGIDFDNAGNAWIGVGTEGCVAVGGVFKYDGSVFTYVTPANAWWGQTDVVDVAFAPNGNIVIADYAGVSVYNGITYTEVLPSSTGISFQYQSFPRMYQLTKDASGTLVFATGQGVMRWNTSANTWSLYNYYSYPDDPTVYSVHADASNTDWLGYQSMGVVKYSNSSFTPISLLNGPFLTWQMNILYIDKHNNKWFKGITELVKLDNAQTVTAFGPAVLPGQVVSMSMDAANNYWIGTTGGLVKFNGSSVLATWNTANSPMPASYLSNSCIDKVGVIWMVDAYGNLCSFDGNSTWNVHAPLPGSYFSGIAVDDNNVKWFATDSGLVKYDGVNRTVYTPLNSGLPHYTVLSICIGPQNVLWAGTENGLARYDGLTWQVYRSDNSPLPANVIPALAYDSIRNDLWICTDKYNGYTNLLNSAGVAKFDGASWIVYTVLNSPIPSNNMYYIKVDQYSNKWMSAYYGIALMNETGITLGSGEAVNVPGLNLSVYPNPSASHTTMLYQLDNEGPVEISIFTIDGRFISQPVNGSASKGEHKVSLDTRTFEAGTYLIRCTTKETIRIEHFIVVK
jgi:ligand-binding sensor domain-containing protein